MWQARCSLVLCHGDSCWQGLQSSEAKLSINVSYEWMVFDAIQCYSHWITHAMMIDDVVWDMAWRSFISFMALCCTVLVPTVVYERDLEHEQNRRCRLHRDGGLTHKALHTAHLPLAMSCAHVDAGSKCCYSWSWWWWWSSWWWWWWWCWCWLMMRMTFILCEYIVPRGCEHTDTDETIMSLHYRRPQLPPFHKWHAGVARGSSWKAGESCVAVWPTSFPAAFPCHWLGHRFPRNTLVALVARGKLQDSPRVWRFGRFTSVAPKLDTSPTSAMSHHYEANIHQRPNSGLKSQTDLNCMLAFDQFYPWEILISHIFSHLIPDLINLILKFLHFLGLCGIFQRQIFRMISQHLLRPWPLVLDYFALVGLGRLATGPGHQWRWSRQGWRWILSAVDAQHVGFEAPPKVKLPKWQEQESRND